MDAIDPSAENWQIKARQNRKLYNKVLSTRDAKKWIPELPEMHESVFEQVDCLDCARCCKNISPRFKVPDIKRISKHIGLRESEMIEKYLQVDEDGDFVVQQSPCPFLAADNTCNIYDVRPRDCQNYPYTDSDQLIKRPTTTLLNSSICPAVHLMLERMI